MPLPGSRDETVAPNGLVRSALINSIQDAIVGINTTLAAFLAAFTGDHKFAVSPSSGQPDASGKWLLNSTALYWEHLLASNDDLWLPVEVLQGERIKSLTVFYDEAANGNFGWKLERVDMLTGTVTTVISGTATGTGQQSKTTAASGGGHVVLAGNQYRLTISSGAIASMMRFYGAEILTDRP